MERQKKIYLAGLDGYSKDIPEKYEIDDLFKNYRLEPKAKKIISLTPTNYRVKIIKKFNE